MTEKFQAPEGAPAAAIQPLPQPEFDALMDHIYEHGTMAEGITARARAMCEAYARAALAAQHQAAPVRCEYCDGTGDVHRADGEWLGECNQCPAAALHAFKNFHRLLCERFGYGHDEKDWRRDQLSLIEFIAAKIAAPAEGDGMLKPLIYAAMMHNGKPKTVAEFERAAATVADMLERRASEQPLPETLPHPGSPEADKMLDALLAEYGQPVNMKNAARAGYMAAKRLLQHARQPLPATDDAEPNVQPKGTSAYAEVDDKLLTGQAQYLISALMNHGLLPGKTLPEDKYLKLWDVVKAQLRAVHREAVRAAQAPAWVWNPARTSWEAVHVPGHWQEGALYAFGPLPEPLAAPSPAPVAEHVPVSPEHAAAIDDALGLVLLPPIRVDRATHAALMESANSTGKIIQAVVRDRLAPYAVPCAAVGADDARDAARYRFIRNADRSDDFISYDELMSLSMESLDRVIDTAMKQEAASRPRYRGAGYERVHHL